MYEYVLYAEVIKYAKERYSPSTLSCQCKSETRVPIHRDPYADNAQSLRRDDLSTHNRHSTAGATQSGKCVMRAQRIEGGIREDTIRYVAISNMILL